MSLTYEKIFQALVVLLVVSFSLSPFMVANAEVVEDSWTSKAPMQEARTNLGVAVVNGKIYAIGGIIAPPSWGQSVGTNEEYDPTTNTWTFKTPMPTPRASFGIAVYQNKIYVIGGTSNGGTGVNEVYDPLTDTWETKASMPTPRIGVEASAVDGKIYLIGGNSSATEAYDPATDSWTTKASMPVTPWLYSGWSCSSAVVDDKIHVIGLGYISGVGVAFHQIYDPETDSWSSGAEWPMGGTFGTAGATTGVLAPKRIYVFGVDQLWWDLSLPNFRKLVYDPENDSWTVGASMPTGRINAGVAVVNDTLYVIGGSTLSIGNNRRASAVNEQYTPFLFGTVPDVSIISPENVTYPSGEVRLNFTVSESTSWMGYSLDGQANVTIKGNTNLTGLSEGTHSLTVYANNVAGDVDSSTTIHFSVDTSPPSVVFLSPKNKTYRTNNVSLAFTVNESTSWIGYSLDGKANMTITGNTTLTGLSYSVHNLTVYTEDTVGNTGASGTIYFTIAQQEPFPTWIIATTVIIAVVGAAILVYFTKIKKKPRKLKSLRE